MRVAVAVVAPTSAFSTLQTLQSSRAHRVSKDRGRLLPCDFYCLAHPGVLPESVFQCGEEGRAGRSHQGSPASQGTLASLRSGLWVLGKAGLFHRTLKGRDERVTVVTG